MPELIEKSVNILLVAFVGGALGGCGWFDDPSPESATVTLTGDAGQVVELLVSKQFVAGVDQNQVTRVQVFQGDTLRRAVPWDTTISIRIEQRFFVKMLDADSVSQQLRMRVLIDANPEYDKAGQASEVFQFVYTFNQPVTNVVELI